MPEFEITSPDGRKFRVTGPDGSTKQDALDQVRARVAGEDMVKSSKDAGEKRAKDQSDKFVQTLDQAMRTVAQGATLGYADRIAAFMGSITGIGGKAGDYAGNLKQEQAKTAAVPSEIAIPGEIGGAVLGTVAGAPLVRGAGAIAGAAVPAVAGAASKLPGIVRGALGGATVGAAAGASQSEDITKQGLQNAASGATTGAITGGAVAGVLGPAGRGLGKLGDKIMTSVIRPTKADIEDGFSLETIKKFDLGGSLNDSYAKTQAKLSDLTTQLRQKLQGSSATIDISKVAADTRADLSTGAGKLKTFGSNQKIDSALDSLDQEASRVASGSGIVSIPDAQLIKQSAGKLGAWQFGRTDPEALASEKVYNTFYSKLKTAIEKASPAGVKEINQDISKLIPVSNALTRRIPVAARNYSISLSDVVALTAAWANPKALALVGLNLAQKSGTVGNLLSKAGPGISGAAPAAGTISGLGSPLFNQQ